MSVIETKDLCCVYGAGTPFEKKALDNVSIKIEEGETVGLIGATGSGKSTLIQHFNGLMKPTSGKVFVDGEDFFADKAKLREVRFKVGLVFQYPEYQLFEETVYKDIAYGPKNMGLPDEEIDRRVRETAELLEITKAQLERSPFELSGGQKRRAAIAGVMAMNPKVLILDEPASGLDPHGRDTIYKMIERYKKATGATVLVVSHSMEDAARLSDRILVMDHGNVFAFDTPDEIFKRSEELEKIGLSVPQVTKVFMRLNEKGFGFDDNVYTVEKAVKLLAERFGKGV